MHPSEMFNFSKAETWSQNQLFDNQVDKYSHFTMMVNLGEIAFSA